MGSGSMMSAVIRIRIVVRGVRMTSDVREERPLVPALLHMSSAEASRHVACLFGVREVCEWTDELSSS